MSKEIEWSTVHGEGDIICKCDHCVTEYNYGFEDGPDFKSCQEELKEEGWVSRKINGEWKDFCCKECADNF